MRRLKEHVRRSIVAYLALFVALGGTSYAAFDLPAGSVGERQIKNHAVDPIKFSRQIGGYVRAWATVSADGRALSSSGRVKIGPVFAGNTYGLAWRIGFPNWCAANATVTQFDPSRPGFANVQNDGRGHLTVETYGAQGQPAEEPFDVEVVC